MDPCSALATAIAVTKVVSVVSAILFTFVQDTRHVDQSLKSFYTEIVVLQTAITSIAENLQSTSLRTSSSSAQIEADLWSSVNESLIECNKTCEELLVVLKNVSGGPGSKPFRQTIKQIKLNWENENIQLLRSKVQIHSTSLQLALQVINVYVSNIF
jgi:hypothetical protein